jgi:isopentenyldiphosphate isomerase
LESKRIRLEDILKNISYKKKIEENTIKKEIHEILNVTKDNKLVIK